MIILLVEDNPADSRLLLEIFKANCGKCELAVVEDGVAALEFLRKEGPYGAAITPDLVILDLNLPTLDGREVLQEIKNDENLKHIPVIILTSSEAPLDVCASYKYAASCFLKKPSGLAEFSSLARVINDFWVDKVKYCHKNVA